MFANDGSLQLYLLALLMSKSNPKKSSEGAQKHVVKPEDIGTHLAETSWRVAIPFLVFSLAGIWLDNRYGSEPFFTIVGLTVALTLISVIVYRYAKREFPESFDIEHKQ